MGVLDRFLMPIIRAAGTAMPVRQALNFIGATVADNPATGAIDVTMSMSNASSYTVPIATVDVVLTAVESTVDEVILGGSPAASHTTTIDATATRPVGTPIKVRNVTAHDQYIADRNGSVWTVASGSTLLLEWISGANPTLNAVSVQAIGGALLDSGAIPGANTAVVSDGIGNASWTDVSQAAWTWFKQAMADADQTPSAPNNRAAVYYCTGALTADRKLILPLVRRVMIVINATTGGHNVNAIGATGTGALCTPVGAGGPCIVFCDGVNFTLTP